jgi:protein SHQ1
MPITPRFHLSQTDTHVTIDIRVPHVRVNAQSVEVLVEDTSVHFSSPPYLLVLNFPFAFKEDSNNEGTAKYDPMRDGGMVTMELEKEAPDVWPDLDLMGNLMRPSMKASGPVRATIISEERSEGVDEEDEDEEERFPADSIDLMNIGRPHYGFANMFVAVFTDLVRDGMAAEMLQLANPDETPAEERRTLRWAFENEKFDPDRYLEDVDVSDDYIYECAMGMVAHWNSVDELTRNLANLSTTAETSSYFTEAEAMQLASIAYPILPDDDYNKQQLLMGLLDILYAFVYDHLLTQGDPTVESSWNTTTLSSTLSWLDAFDDATQVVQSSIRRSVIFPYTRNYEFAIHCWKQTVMILNHGRRCVIRSLLLVRSILEKSEFHYLGNKLYVDPYLSWLQRAVKEDDLEQLAKQLEAVLNSNEVQKSRLGLNLVELEEEFLGYSEEKADDDDDDEEESDNNNDDAESSETESPSETLRKVLIEELS